MDYAISLGLFFPLIGFLLILLSSDRICRPSTGVIGCTSIFLSFACFSWLVYHYVANGIDNQDVTLFTWIAFKGLSADFSLHVDHLTLVMCMIITGVGFLIHVYSNGYMDHDEDYARFFTYMNFFVFSMLLLVMAGNLLLLFVGWEGVGLASYLLIGFWYHKPTAARAAIKAFVVNRVGDLGLLLGILLTFYLFGTSDITTINAQAKQQFAVGASIITVLCILYFIGACGKSAQLPLHVWLADAMEGPTPVSALIHAATMVTAGVYLVVRLHPIFELSPTAMFIVACIGAATALFAALCALGQTDLKRVLAYSTVSQLGYMFLACGVGAYYAAMFHLTMHAFIKALLFLSAGNVVHMSHEVTQMAEMGGLRHKFKLTSILFLIGVLALSGIPPFAAFFSKELILEVAYLDNYLILFSVGLFTAILTAFYLTRAYCLTFTGKPRMEEAKLATVHEAPSIMTAPVSVLALLSVIGGFLGFSFQQIPLLEGFLTDVDVTTVEKELSTGLHLSAETWIAIAGGILGIALASVIYTRYLSRLGGPLAILRKAFFVDEIYEYLFFIPLELLAQFVANIVEPNFFDGMIRGVANTTARTAHWLQQVQSGQIRSYVAWMAVGMVLLIAYFVF